MSEKLRQLIANNTLSIRQAKTIEELAQIEETFFKSVESLFSLQGVVVPRLKTHYAPSGEWGNPKTYCGRYWTTDVKHRALMDEVTCKR
jgi:hypothetical protein